MKLASLKGGRDGRLVVVSNDLAYFAYAGHIATTLQDVLDNWDMLAPKLELLATDLEHAVIPRERFHERDAAAPLPRSYGVILDGKHMPGDAMLGARDGLAAPGTANIYPVALTGDIAKGASAAEAQAAIRLVGLMTSALSCSPVFATPDSFGTLCLEVNGATHHNQVVAADFAAPISVAAQDRPIGAGTLIGASPIAACAITPGDTIRIRCDDEKHHPIFGVIEHKVM